MLLIFEDETWRHFAPLSHTRPLFDIRCGAFTQRERVIAAIAYHKAAHAPHVQTSLPAPTNSDCPLPEHLGMNLPAIAPTIQRDTEMVAAGLCRPYLMDCYGPSGGTGAMLRSSTPLTLVNGRALDIGWLPQLLDAPVGTVYETAGTLLGARLSPALASVALYYLREQQAADALGELRRFGQVREIKVPLLTYPWDLISQAGEQLVRDMPLLAARLPRYVPDNGHIVVRGEHVYVAPTAQLDGPLVLDARDGPIFVDEQAHIEPFSFIQGPAYIGKKTLISSALIRGETSFGPVCRIGGEVEASTVQGYSNKHHEGFLGHSWLGEWVNIGAMTTNSDLKNTYGSIKVAIQEQGNIDSGEIKLGCFLADHVKLGIGMHITGGAVIGTGSNLFGIHMIPKTVPPFVWGSEVFYEYQIDRMIGVAHKVMGRRKLELSAASEAVLRAVFAMTRANRLDLGRDLTSQKENGGSAPGLESLELLARAEADAMRAYDQAQSGRQRPSISTGRGT